MRAYSTDLRQKIVHAYERRLGSQRALAALFGVRVSFVEKLLRRHRKTGDVAPKPHAGGHKRRLAAAAETLLREGTLTPRMQLSCTITRGDGTRTETKLTMRLDTRSGRYVPA